MKRAEIDIGTQSLAPAPSFESIFEALPLPTIIADKESGKAVFANTLFKKNFPDILDSSVKEFKDFIQKNIENIEENTVIEFNYLKGSDLMSASVNLSEIKSHGRTYIAAMISDHTMLHNKYREAVEKQTLLEIISKSSELLFDFVNFKENLQIIIKSIADSADIKSVLYFSVRSEIEEVFITVDKELSYKGDSQINESNSKEIKILRKDLDPEIQNMRVCKPLLTNIEEVENSMFKAMQTYKIENCLIVPAVLNGQVYGVFAFNKRIADEFQKCEIDALTIFSNIFASALKSKDERDSLDEMALRFKLFAEHINEGILITKNYKYDFANKKFLEICGINEDELHSGELADWGVIDLYDIDNFVKYHKPQDSKLYEMESWINRKNEENNLYVKKRFYDFRDFEKDIINYLIVTDLTDKKLPN
jgi:PAS domain-containing protein